MESSIGGLMELAQREFDGRSANGKSLFKQLEALSAEAAASVETFEGYSAWEVAQHCLFGKYIIAKALGANVSLDPYPYVKDDFAPITDTSAQAWKDFLVYLGKTHKACMDAIAASSSGALAALIPEWECSVMEVLPWFATHDTYHVAQIRSMGVSGLRRPKADLLAAMAKNK